MPMMEPDSADVNTPHMGGGVFRDEGDERLMGGAGWEPPTNSLPSWKPGDGDLARKRGEGRIQT